jgi:starch synthase
MNVLTIASECTPFSRETPAADVVAALPRALARLGVSSMIVLPRYPSIDPGRYTFARRLAPIHVGGEAVTIYEGRLPSGTVRVIFLDHPLMGGDDAAARYALLTRGALEVAHQLGAWPDAIHAHGWQAGLAPLLARDTAGRPAPKTVFTVHDASAQGLFDRATVERIGLGWDVFTPDGAEYHGQLSFLKAGIAYADRIGALSPRHARELVESASGLEGFLAARKDRIVGLQSGIDTDAWNPERDGSLAAPYSAGALGGKAACKEALQREAGLAASASAPLAVFAGPVTDARGADLLAELGDRLVESGGQLVVIGAGSQVDALAAVASRHPAEIAVLARDDERLAHRAIAGADVALVPARAEVAGTPALVALRYGTIPVVPPGGALGDLIVDYDRETRTGNGFVMDALTTEALLEAMKRTTEAFADRAGWSELTARVMRTDHSWDRAARRYLDVFAELTGAARRAG